MAWREGQTGVEGEAEGSWLPGLLLDWLGPIHLQPGADPALWVGQNPTGSAPQILWDPCSHLQKDLQPRRVQPGRLSPVAPAQWPGAEVDVGVSL